MTQAEGILKSGELLNNTYVIEYLVGQGGTGEVYLAKNIVSGRKFAIKILKQEFANNETFINLMRRESDVLHEVRDDAVVRYNELLRSEMHGGFVFLVMEYIEGPQLADIVKERGGLDEESLLLVAQRMGRGLKAAHDKKAFHRDMSPDNIIIPDSDMSKAKLIDFGIARDINDNAQTVVGGGFAGKYQYASPEQMDGNVDARSDLYSLGMTLLRAYRGKPIEVGTSLMEIVKNKSIRPDTRDVPGKLGQLITRLVEPNPADRFQSAAEMLAFLKGGPQSQATPVPMDEATVIAPQTQQRRAQATTTMPPEPGVKSGGGGGKWFAILLVLAALGGSGWYFGLGPGKEMIFGPAYPAADPYVLEIASAGGPAPIRVAGNITSPEAGSATDAALAALLAPSDVQSQYEFASGVPSPDWVDNLPQLVGMAAELSQWKVVIDGKTIFLSGEADDAKDAEEAATDAMRVAALLGYELNHNITSVAEPLELAALNAELQTYQTCGPLRVTGGDGVQLAEDDRLTVSGIIARQQDVEVIDLVLRDLVLERGIDYNLAILNAPVCMIEAMLPSTPSIGIDIAYSYGGKSGSVQDGVYHAGENPVIDVLLPEAKIGFFYGFYIDAEGQVFHLLPHKDRPNNVLPSVGSAENGVRSIRLAFPADEANTEKLGFNVIEPYGTSMIVAMVTESPLFDGLRPRAESVEAFRDALARAQATVSDGHTLVAARYLVTEE